MKSGSGCSRRDCFSFQRIIPNNPIPLITSFLTFTFDYLSTLTANPPTEHTLPQDQRPPHPPLGLTHRSDPPRSPEWTSLTTGHLSHLLIPRPSGSSNNTLIQNYLITHFTSLSWQITTQTFISPTPIGEIHRRSTPFLAHSHR
jgi:hypothetical protein